MSKYHLIVYTSALVLMIGLFPVSAQELAHIPASFLDIGYGARPMGMGRAYTALANDAYALNWNPAGLMRGSTPRLSFFHTRQFNLIPYSMAVYAHPSGDRSWTHGEGIIVSGDDALRETTLLFGFAYDMQEYVSNLTVGSTVSYHVASFGNNSDGRVGQITGSAVGLSVDIGLLYSVSEWISAGVVLGNVIDFMSWNTTGLGTYVQGNPMTLRVGFALQPNPKTVLGLDLEKALHPDTRNHLHVGVERTIHQHVDVRGGVFQGLDTLSGLNYSIGFGVHYPNSFADSRIDMAYVLQEIANTLYVSLSFTF